MKHFKAQGRINGNFLILIVISLSLFIVPVIGYAREYCCVGPYYCEEFDDYDTARANCMLSDTELASSYSCSHKHNHYFCQSCCVSKNASYVVYDKNDCDDGIFVFQSDCQDLGVNVFGTLKDKKGNYLQDIEVKIGDKKVLSRADGKFNLSLPRGTYDISFKDYDGKYYKGTMLKMLNYKENNLGTLTFNSNSFNQFHGEQNEQIIVNGYIRSKAHPYSVYSINGAGLTTFTNPSGYFEFVSAGRITQIEATDMETGNTFRIPYSMFVGKNYFFYKELD